MREALTLVARHVGATLVIFSLHAGSQGFVLCIAGNCESPQRAAEPAGKSHGLLGMFEPRLDPCSRVRFAGPTPRAARRRNCTRDPRTIAHVNPAAHRHTPFATACNASGMSAPIGASSRLGRSNSWPPR